MRLAGVIFVLAFGFAFAACDDGRSPATPSPLSDTDRLAIARQIVLAVAGGLARGSGVGQSDGVPLGGVDCQETCAGPACSVRCPIDERYDCAAGGRVRDEGQIEGSLDASLSGQAALATAQTYVACRPNTTLTLSGDRSTTATGAARFVDGQLAREQRVLITGAVGYVSTTEGSGRCAVELDVALDRSAHGSADGMACGKPVNVAF